LPVHIELNGEWFGHPDAGQETVFPFGQILAHLARTRALGAGSIVGAGTIGNADPKRGNARITEARVRQMLAGVADAHLHPYLKHGDRCAHGGARSATTQRVRFHRSARRHPSGATDTMSWDYEPPWRDMRFVIEELLDLPAHWARMPALAHADAELAAQLIDEAGRFARKVLLPLNASGDLEGCRLYAGAVHTPKGFRAAYQAFVAAGWPALACDAASGGQGLPQVLNAAVYEMLAACNHAWTMYPGLLHGAYECLHRHGSAELRERYLAKIVSGEWLATMALTESQAGSDLGRIATRAQPRDDGSYAISGGKIFISGGDHDLSDNIVHLVLARMPDAPPGSKGLTLFLAPKHLPDGTRNAVFCDGLEHKLGIKGSATCVLRLEAATGWIVGEPNRGLAAMFAMMNAARLHVGLQGLGHAEVATQNALRYAQERVQGGGQPIANHPGVQRTLLSLRARVEGGRALAYWVAQLIDVVEHSDDPAETARAQTLAALLTPVVKACLSQHGFEAASDALQLWGGHGYVRDYGIEQTLRDARIAMIYEGSNEIQAIDLLLRKGVCDGGRGFELLFDELAASLPDDALHGAAVRRALVQVRETLARVLGAAAQDAQAPLRVATDWLQAMGIALYAHGFARADALAARALAAGSAEPEFYRAKRATADCWMRQMLPRLQAHLAVIDTELVPAVSRGS
jgi:alkylation response protein AidB-like acyl-CoA dehydrogenase